ncbi:hypothetical protein R1sor_012000 [Riccia sorocarpa]|uniref:Uncharacterized protein n=1 Tax=Riccia sorocarpa TaxID=122646 RepID=A0ABD3I8P9_9MARC
MMRREPFCSFQLFCYSELPVGKSGPWAPICHRVPREVASAFYTVSMPDSPVIVAKSIIWPILSIQMMIPPMGFMDESSLQGFSVVAVDLFHEAFSQRTSTFPSYVGEPLAIAVSKTLLGLDDMMVKDLLQLYCSVISSPVLGNESGPGGTFPVDWGDWVDMFLSLAFLYSSST